MAKRKQNRIERDLIEGMTGLVDDLKNDRPIKYTRHNVSLDLPTEIHGPAEVKATRKLMNVSQTLFGQFVGVSVKTVQSWENGDRTPSPIACRFMSEIRRNPALFNSRLNDLVREKAS